MGLKDGAVNEIIPFAAAGEVGAGDLMSLETYRGHIMRQRGHQPGLALRELQNREARQATHMAAGLAQFIANRYAPGVRDDGDLDKVEAGLLQAVKTIAANGRLRVAWTLAAAVTDGAMLDLPDEAKYVVGSGALLLVWDGLVLDGENYTEVGGIGESSKVVRLLFDAPAGSRFLAILDAPDMDDDVGTLAGDTLFVTITS